jgi:pimeloyl-ACP methyl ester carboxylesterase
MTGTPAARTVALRGGMFDVRVAEAGAGQPLVYLHGAEGPHEGWPEFLAALARDCRVVAPDLPGFGRSTGAEHLTEVVDLVVWTLDLLDALGLERPHVLGHDLGGMLACELAALAGGRVGRLVLAAPLGLWDDREPVLDVFAVPRDEVAAAYWHDPASPAATAMLAAPADEEEARRRTLLRHQNLAAATRFLWPIPDRGLKKRLHRVAAETLVIWGAEDRVAPPSYADRFARAMPRARTVVLPDCGHLPMLERPGPFVEAARSLLDG